MRLVISFGSKYLLQFNAEPESSIARFKWMIKLYLLGRSFLAVALNLMFLPWFTSNSCLFVILSNSMSNHPGHDPLTSQIFFIFSLFVDSVEMINPWKFQPSTLYGSKVTEIWKFDRNGCSGIKSFLNLYFL